MRALFLCLLAVLLGAGCSDFQEPVGGVGVRICGNGVIEPGEECDDGNDVTERCPWGEGSCVVCDSSCKLVPGEPTYCGDGILQAPWETCDDGNTVDEPCAYGDVCTICNETCHTRVVFRYCGDGLIDEDGEEACDDGLDNSATLPDACRPDCKLPSCGDGVVDSGEECEPEFDDRCRDDCVLMRCGDGILDPGEECDPGLDPECRPDCVAPRCGDGIRQTGEACDDGEVAIADIAWRPGSSCLIDAEGQVRCAGVPALDAIPAALEGGAIAITLGEGFACAIAGAPGAETGAIVCWGEEPVGDPQRPVLLPPSGKYRAIAAGDAHVCALDANGVAACWGSIDTREITVRVGFRSVASGRGFSCARHFSGDVQCWGSRAFGVFEKPPGLFATLDVGAHHVCARDMNLGTSVCWGDDADGKTAVPEGIHLDGFALGDHASCALDEDGMPICWGAPLWPPPPAGPFDRLIAAGAGVCGLRDGAIVCWGADAPVLPANADGVAGACREDCQAPRCGDGVVDPGEGCDGGEGCSDTCQPLGVCGDGIVQPATETCDDGNTVTETCPWNTSCEVCDASCQLRPGAGPRCGDGLLHGPEEECDDGDAGIPFESIAMGQGFGCGLLPDETIRCWGELQGPDGADWVGVTAGIDFACGLRRDGSIACWGGREDPAPQEGAYQRIVAAGTGVCALDEIGAIRCWSVPGTPPAGSGFVELDVGLHGGCAIDAGGALRCWGPLPPPPAGAFVDVAIGTFLSCAIDGDQRLHCWGADHTQPVGDRRVVAIDGDGPVCAVDLAGQAFCLGTGIQVPPAGAFRDVAMVGAGGCLLAEDGLVDCWPSITPRPPFNTNRQTTVACRLDCRFPTCGDSIRDPWEECDVGEGAPPWDACEYDRACVVCGAGCTQVTALRPHCGDGVLDEGYEGCDDGGPVEALGLGDGFACLFHSDGRPRCWGADDEGQSQAPYGTYSLLAVGARHVCAVDRSGVPWCWGASDLGQTAAPRVLLQAIEAGRDFTCGLDVDGAIACWGDVPFATPTGIWVEIAAGDRHLCARDGAGELSCWGADDRGQSSPPFGAFDQLAVGAHHGCARGVLGEVICWGRNDRDQTTPPAGLEAAWIVAGRDRSCAGTADGIVCWGADGPLPAGELQQLVLPRWGVSQACGIDAEDRPLCAGPAGSPAADLPALNDDEAPGACRSDCQPARCGDGVIDPGETCDDGNDRAGDGCSDTCQIE